MGGRERRREGEEEGGRGGGREEGGGKGIWRQEVKRLREGRERVRKKVRE